MKTEIISIGDELLIGQVINTNSSWIAQQLNQIGISVYQIITISDHRQHILKALEDANSLVDVIIITGGLGPTKDDITKQTICEYFNSTLIFNSEVFKDIEFFFANKGLGVTELNRKQAEVPDNCIPIKNKNGTAPGMWFEKEGKIFISLPGVPFEMKPMINDFVIPQLSRYNKEGAIIHKTILTQGIGESFLTEIIKLWEDNLPGHIKLAYLPSPGIVRLRLTATGKNRNSLNKDINNCIIELQKLIPEYIYGYDDDRLEEIIGKLLKKKCMTISTAESCTGGYIAHRITSVPGSSAYFKGSVISYANEIKTDILGVNIDTITKYGAVSEEVVIEMAKNVRTKINTDYAIATSGIAGPDGGTPEKPVGTVWIAIAAPEKIIANKYLFGENRERNIQQTAITALNLLRKQLIETI